MNPSPEQIEDLYRQEVLRARQMPPEDKLLAGARLFELACQITKSGIRNQFPEADEDAVQSILARRLAWRRMLDERDSGDSVLKEQRVEN
jgi:hypothetical protein